MSYAERKAQNWNIRGAWKDSFWLKFADTWRFPCGTNHLYGVEVISFGELWQTPFDNNAVASLRVPIEIVPTLSSFSYEYTPSNSYRFVWENAAIARNTNNLVTASLELFRNGDIFTITNGVVTYKERVLPSEWGDPGEDGFYGNDNTLPSGADEDAYYWIDLVVSNAVAKVKFIGEGESNYPDPDFVAKENSTNRVVLLIGKPYTVTCDEAIGIIAKSDEDINVDHISENEIKIVWPLQFDVSHETMYTTPRATTTVPVQGGFIIETFPLLIGVYTWETNKCCDFKSESFGKLWRFSCQDDCYCTGCSFEGVFVYEGYRHPVVDLSCGCTHKEEPSATASISFSKSAVIFENSYTNAPNDIVPRRSTTNSLDITIYGGPFGGIAEIDFDDNGKLEYLASDAIPRSISVAAEQMVNLSFSFIGKKESVSENDIKASLKFTEYFTGDVTESDDEMTAVRVCLTPQVVIHTFVNRHVWGIAERILCEWLPANINIDITPHLGVIDDNPFFVGPSFRYYISPMNAGDRLISFSFGDSIYFPVTKTMLPISWKAKNAKELFFDIPFGKPGGAGFSSEVYIMPECVSFRGLYFMEEPSTNSIVTGYFKDEAFSQVWTHNEMMGAGMWYSVSADNFLFRDEAKMGDELILPVASGLIDWNIPVKWTNFSVTNYFEKVYHQKFEMSATGVLRVSKFGLWVQRDLSNVRDVSEGVKRCCLSE
jgi:hypothetical protein